MRAYYDALFDGELGFELARVEATYPSLLGVSVAEDTIRYLDFEPASPDVFHGGATGLVIDLGMADESFTVYERPKPMLFRKTTALSESEYAQILSTSLPPPGRQLATPESPSLLMSAELAEAQDEGGTWTDIMPTTGRGSGTELVLWLLAIQGIALAGFPLMARIFRPAAGQWLPARQGAFFAYRRLPWRGSARRCRSSRSRV